tara:strand:+ start:6236 stop:8320 length:2085 start_codon:yes stop_codon:yes gene_type:complete
LTIGDYLKACERLFTFLIVLLVCSCVATEQKKQATVFQEAAKEPVNNTSPIISGTPVSNVREGFLYSFSPTILQANATYSLIGAPSWLSINSSTGHTYGYANDPGIFNNITIRALLNDKKTDLGPFSIYVSGDPLAQYQWHLNNNGQSSFALNSGSTGYDINILPALNLGITGNGVRVAVSDTGLELTHADLANNIYSNNSKNYSLSPPYLGNPAPTGVSGDHGTSVAGIISAVGWNQIGGRGVAPDSLVAGYNFIDSDQTSAMQLDQAQGDVDLFNYSYGNSYIPTYLTYDFVYEAQVKNGFLNQRNSKGQVYVKSAGNSFLECDLFQSFSYLIDSSDSGYFCFSHNATAGNENNIPYMIIVGALNAKGEKSSYSSTGSSLWISAPGGEYGATDPAIVTTDQSSCAIGYSRSDGSGTDFQNGGDTALNPDCDYTHTFNGTSSAAPMVSGVVALLMQANPNLTSRNIKDILAKTATKVNYSTASISHSSLNSLNLDLNLSGHVYEQGYVTNAAGYSFHNYYGFGAVNAGAAVTMAQSYVNTMGTQQQLNETFSDNNYKSTVGQAIPDASATGLSNSINVATNLTIEAIQIKVNITHPRPGDIGIELTSPSGTKSIITNINNSFLMPIDNSGAPYWFADLVDYVLLTNAFYGESSQGNWTIKVIDGLGPSLGNDFDLASGQTGTLDDWAINVVGY